jgi:CRP-like cAMP-binding protein
MDAVIEEMVKYAPLSEECIREIRKILRRKTISKNDFYLREGTIPRTIAFVKKGLFSYFYVADNGDIVIKKFFPEKSFVSSTSALIKKAPGLFNIYALEDTEILEYDAAAFWKLIERFPDLAIFHIRYLEKNWVADKEDLEITLKYQTAKERYLAFLKDYPALQDRLKQHHIASYLGITPTQLSRIRKEL